KRGAATLPRWRQGLRPLQPRIREIRPSASGVLILRLGKRGTTQVPAVRSGSSFHLPSRASASSPIERDPRGRVVAGFREAAQPAVDSGVAKLRLEPGAEKHMIDAQSRVALPAIAEVIPERVDPFFGMELTQRIGPSLFEQPAVTLARLRLQQRVLAPRLRV